MKLDIDLKNRESPPVKPSIEEQPRLELTSLPPHLCYVFLGCENPFLMIIAADLLYWQVEVLMLVLKKFIKVVGWTITDIIKIPPDICTHKIQLDVDCRPSIKHQSMLNPLMQEVKEINYQMARCGCGIPYRQ